MIHRIAAVMTVAAVMLSSSAFAHDIGRAAFGWALLSKGPTVATTTDELSRLDRWTSDGDRVLYARFGEDEYLIRDLATLERADDLVEPIRKLGEKARELRASSGVDPRDKAGRREWKERLRPFKEKRRELLTRVSPQIESLARDAVSKGKAERLH